MTLLTFPAIGCTALDWHLQPNTQTFTSPLSRAQQTLELPGAIWAASVTMKTMTEAQWRDFSVFIARCRGAAGRFLFSPPHAGTPRGAVGGAPVASAGGGTGRLLQTQGWPASANVLRPGDFFSVQTGAEMHEMKIITVNAGTDAAGRVVLAFEPPLRRPPLAGAAIVTQGPVCVMRLNDDDQGRLALRAGPKATCTLSLVEAIP